MGQDPAVSVKDLLHQLKQFTEGAGGSFDENSTDPGDQWVTRSMRRIKQEQVSVDAIQLLASPEFVEHNDERLTVVFEIDNDDVAVFGLDWEALLILTAYGMTYGPRDPLRARALIVMLESALGAEANIHNDSEGGI